MNPVDRRLYETFFFALSRPLKGDLRKKMDRMRKDLLELPQDTGQEMLIAAYRERIPEVCVILEEHSLNIRALDDSFPDIPRGLEAFSSLKEKNEEDQPIFFTLSEAFETCLKINDFDLALKINQQERTKQREPHLRQLIKARFSFDEGSEAVPEEFKRLYRLMDEEQHLLIWETVFPEGLEGPALQNPKILREFADMTHHESLKQLLTAKINEKENSWWCRLF